MPNYDSFYRKYSNQSLEWLGTDSESEYKKNLATRYDELEKYGWIDSKFTYKFNSYGFRCDEFTTSPTIMFLGCSNTFGVGLPLEKTWAQIISNHLNMKCANLGIPGSSCDSAFRLCHGYLDKIKPKLVIMLTPPGIRFEFVSDTDITNNNVSNIDFYYKRWSRDDNNHYFNQEKNILAIRMLCLERNTKFVLSESSEFYNISESLARDLKHRGIESSKIFSDNLLKRI